jgi:hypothetical protein
LLLADYQIEFNAMIDKDGFGARFMFTIVGTLFRLFTCAKSGTSYIGQARVESSAAITYFSTFASQRLLCAACGIWSDACM